MAIHATAVDMPRSVTPLLSVNAVSKSFGGARALSGVSTQFYPGEVHALLGENGAGKSTLVKIIAGIAAADSGSIDGTATDSDDRIAMVFQELSVMPDLSVAENLSIAYRRRGRRRGPIGKQPRVRDALAAAGLGDLDLRLPVSSLSLGERQLLEIAKALATQADVLILDEPTATLSDVEIGRVHSAVRRAAAQGKSIIYITHRLGEVFTLSDRLTILRAGEIVAIGPSGDFEMSEVVAHMLGHDHAPVDRGTGGTTAAGERRALSLTGASDGRSFEDVDLELTAGRVTAVFGQLGSGADEVVRSLAGLVRLRTGQITVDGAPIGRLTSIRARKLGISFVSADRVVEGVFLEASVTRNLSSGALPAVSRFGVLSNRAERDFARATARRVALSEDRLGSRVGELSGGNQQKVAIGRALAQRPSVLVLDEPTRGVDIGARTEIYRQLRTLAADGLAIVLYSSDIVEIREFADLVVTMFRGRVVGRHEIDQVPDRALLSEILHGGNA